MVTEAAQDIFGLYNVRLQLFSDPQRTKKLDNVQSGSTVYVSRWNDQGTGPGAPSNGFNCNFVNVSVGGKVSSVLLENPKGKSVDSLTEAFRNLAKANKVKIYSDNQKKSEVSMDKLCSLVGKTLYL